MITRINSFRVQPSFGNQIQNQPQKNDSSKTTKTKPKKFRLMVAKNIDAIQVTRATKDIVLHPMSYVIFNEERKKAEIETQKDLEAQIKPENLIRTEQNSEVYTFTNPNFLNWVIKVDKKPAKDAENLQEFKRIPDKFPDVNLGQEIARIGDKSQYHILKRVEGEPHSIPNWADCIDNGSEVTYEQALHYLKFVERLAYFSQSTYDQLAKQLDALTKKGYKVDGVNPNSIMINYRKQEMNITNFFKAKDPTHINSRYDLICPLLDFALFKKYYDVLKPHQQNRMLNSCLEIKCKCHVATLNYPSINQNEETYLDFLDNIDKWYGFALETRGGSFRSRYKELKKFYSYI